MITIKQNHIFRGCDVIDHDGHRIRNIRSLRYEHAGVGEVPVLTLEILALDGIEIEAPEAEVVKEKGDPVEFVDGVADVTGLDSESRTFARAKRQETR